MARWKPHESGLVASYEQYPALPYWINGGFMIFEQEALAYMENGDDVALETGALQEMIADRTGDDVPSPRLLALDGYA